LIDEKGPVDAANFMASSISPFENLISCQSLAMEKISYDKKWRNKTLLLSGDYNPNGTLFFNSPKLNQNQSKTI
jgi:hypothetical protein